MHTPHRHALVAALAGAVLVLAGCSPADDGGSTEETAATPVAQNVIQPGAPGEGSTRLDPSAVPEVPAPEHTEADVEFLQQMIGHHAQAVVMTALVPERASMDRLSLFAERMDISQVAEIEQMQEWLRARGEDAPAWDPVFGAQGGHSSGTMIHAEDDLMPGMLTDAQLDDLAAAEGEEFDRLFLQYMTLHHEGARQMVADLFEAGGGGDVEIFQIAAHIESDQSIEIDRMAQMMAELDAR